MNSNQPETESYVLFVNVDETILQLNPSIRELGFEFVMFDLSERIKFHIQFLDIYR